MTKQNENFDDFKQSVPTQLEFFFIRDEIADKYSHTIELYDFVPKYVVGKTQDASRIEGRYLEPIKRTFQNRGKDYQVTLVPARIEVEDNVFIDYFLGVREEIVEDALRKLAVEGQGIMLDNQIGMCFTLYQVRMEVMKSGHTYSNDQIIEALKIMANASIQISGLADDEALTVKEKSKQGKKIKNGKELFFHPLESLSFDSGENQTPTFVRFSPLVTKSIQENTFRMINYRQSMAHQSFIGRMLFKRMSHHFIQADITKPYTILLSTIIRDFGLTHQARLKSNLENVEKALSEMREKDSILSFKVEKIYDQHKKIKWVDASIQLIPSVRFSADAKSFNAKAKQNQSRMTNLLGTAPFMDKNPDI